MVLRKIVGIAMIALLVGAASVASATTPDLTLSTSSRADGSAATAVVFNLPDGSGAAFSDAVSDAYAPIDATISVTLLNANGIPVPNFPMEDLYLVNDDGSEFGGLMVCGGFATADANSDANGMTQWANPLLAGGNSAALTVIMVSGAPLESSAGEAVSFNSSDINGDLEVNLVDVVQFAGDFGGYTFRSDFRYDGVLDLLDVVILGQTQSVDCP